MLLKSEIKLNDVYAYDVEGMCSGIHVPTRTVKIVEIEEVPEYKGFMGDTSPAHTSIMVECQQSGQLFSCGPHMLTTIDRAKRMYDSYKDSQPDSGEMDYSYNKTMKRLEEILFQVELSTL